MSVVSRALQHLDAAAPGVPRFTPRAAGVMSGSSVRFVARAVDEQTAVAESGFEWPRYPRILVALDESPAASFALRHVIPYAVDQRLQLTLLTVVPARPRMVVAAGVLAQRMAEEMERQAKRHLRQVTATLPHELSMTTVLRHGDPAEEILAPVRAQPVDLICMGARGRGRVSGALLGSASSAVLHHSPVPVVVLQPPHEPGGAS